MHARDNADAKATPPARQRRRTPSAPAPLPALPSPTPLHDLHGKIGNAAVVQLLRQADHPWAQPQPHEHGPGCAGHQGGGGRPATVQRSAVHDVLRTQGQPLDHSTRADMEARLGADLSDVRIHNDAPARASAAEMGARAYTSGSHVVIGAGGADQHTLAHELTHVLQQRSGPVAGTDNGAGLRVSDPSDRFEREAEENARRVTARPRPERAAAGEASGSAGTGSSVTGPSAAGPAPQPSAGAAVQRKLDFSKAAWAAQFLNPDAFAALLTQASGTENGPAPSIPYRDLFQKLDVSGVTIHVDEGGAITGRARASFAPDRLEGNIGGTLRLTPPPPTATAAVLRSFAAEVTHEMQHALDSVEKRLSPKEKPQNDGQRKISSELRAFGREAGAAVKLAIGDSYDRSEGTLTQILDKLGREKISEERKQLAREFQILNSYHQQGTPPAKAFTPAGGKMQIAIGSSQLLDRLRAYLVQYKLADSSTTHDSALQWLTNPANSEVLQKGLVEGIVQFDANRPKPAG